MTIDLFAGFQGDYLYDLQTLDHIAKIKQGRMGICLFGMGMYVIYKAISLMMPDVEEEYLPDKRRCSKVKAMIQNS